MERVDLAEGALNDGTGAAQHEGVVHDSGAVIEEKARVELDQSTDADRVGPVARGKREALVGEADLGCGPGGGDGLLVLELLFLLELMQPLVEQSNLLAQSLDLHRRVVRGAHRDQTGGQHYGRQHGPDER